MRIFRLLRMLAPSSSVIRHICTIHESIVTRSEVVGLARHVIVGCFLGGHIRILEMAADGRRALLTPC